ncbi:MAG: hypothetical protein IBX57_00935 [Gammaproteobacteria bacterium]|nr:hypothetical protein [Gammaproteobacteria bacterium]
MLEESKLKFYSMGIVSQNKLLDSDTVYIYPIEMVPFADGDLKAMEQEVIGAGVDKNNIPYQIAVNVDSSVEADWLRLGNTNRRTSPDVRRGERVLLYRYSNSEKLYWESWGADDHLRKLETVIYTWSATRDENADSTKPENSYSLEVCTHTKQVTFRTSKADGEPFAYTMQFNTEYGAVVLQDDDDNYFEFDSTERRFTFKNRDEAHFIIDKEDMDIYLPNDLNITADNNVNATVGNNLTLKVGEILETQVGNEGTIDVANKLLFKVGGATIELTPDLISTNASKVQTNS